MAEDSERGRIAVLPAVLADQIAAGEVVERPGSIVKELLDNAIDAGASRVELELEAGGAKAIRIIDDGRGIHRDDLALALTRHATSKLRRPEQLVEILTLGFRGEALASIAAVARVELRSRPRGQAVGHRLVSIPGEPQRVEPIGMPEGTQVLVEHLFANVPARRKFLRSEATEVGHCVEAVVRAALVHPEVHFRVRHHGRQLLELPRSDQPGRVRAVLARRGGEAELMHISGEREGVEVQAWFAPPSAALRQRSASFVVVRRRVVSERTLAGILRQAYGDSLARGTHPVACMFVEPPHGSVDVNVHPQKSEVRFAGAQIVYAAVREIVEASLSEASWWGGSQAHATAAGSSESNHDWAQPNTDASGARAALAGWSQRDGLSLGSTARDAGASSGGGGGGGGGGGARYQLGTRAASANYGADKQGFRGEVERLRARMSAERAPVSRPFEEEYSERMPLGFDAHTRTREHRGEAGSADSRAPAEDAEPPGPRLLTCLPGPVAVFEYGAQLLAADLRRVRAELVRRRMLIEWAATDAEGRAPAQRLLQPVVLRRRPEERARLLECAAELARLGLELEGFGDDDLIVRSVPAALPEVLDAAQVGVLLHRLLPYLALRSASLERTREGLAEAAAEVAGAGGIDTSPRLARRWIVELLAAHDGRIDEDLPGVRVWSPAALVGVGHE